METVTPKTQRRARAALMAKAKAEAEEKNCTLTDALLSIIERGHDYENVIRAFSVTKATSRHTPVVEAGIDEYFKEAN